MAFRNKTERDNWYMFLCADYRNPSRDFIGNPAALVNYKNAIIGIYSYSAEIVIDESIPPYNKCKCITKHKTNQIKN